MGAQHSWIHHSKAVREESWRPPFCWTMGRVRLVPVVPPVAAGNLLPIDCHRQLICSIPSGMIVTGAPGHIRENSLRTWEDGVMLTRNEERGPWFQHGILSTWDCSAYSSSPSSTLRSGFPTMGCKLKNHSRNGKSPYSESLESTEAINTVV